MPSIIIFHMLCNLPCLNFSSCFFLPPALPLYAHTCTGPMAATLQLACRVALLPRTGCAAHFSYLLTCHYHAALCRASQQRALTYAHIIFHRCCPGAPPRRPCCCASLPAAPLRMSCLFHLAASRAAGAILARSLPSGPATASTSTRAFSHCLTQ